MTINSMILKLLKWTNMGKQLSYWNDTKIETTFLN